MIRKNATLTINLNTIAQNVEALKSYLRPGVQFMAVVKANAYGYGAVEVARKLAPQVDWFAVNEVREGIELRQAGITAPVLVFEVPEEHTAALFNKHNLTATISAVEHFILLPKGTQYHLNFNTGMGRLGFRPEQGRRVAELKKDHPELKCTGIYSHFATADERNAGKMHRQFAMFSKLLEYFDHDIPAYISNTGSILQYDNAQLDMVRSGIGIYGYSPGEVSGPKLTPAIRWQTHLVQVNKILKGETVSYGATWKAPADGYTGIIPVGYVDGIPRGLTGNFTVTIKNHDFPVVGTVTMNYCMVYLKQEAMEVGTTVELWNEDHNAGEWAEKMRTIPYEILTGLAESTNRSYVS